MIDYPNLEIRNEDQLAAEAIARVSGGLTVETVQAQIREREEMLDLLASGLIVPICPELTNANPSAPHTVLLEAFAWLLAQMGYRINQIPSQNHIAFANLFGIEPRPATAAETILRFSVNAPVGMNVTIPAETQISDAGEIYVFETSSPLTIPSGTLTGTVSARRIVAGQTLLAPNVLTQMIDSIAFVESVINPSAIDSGTEIESLESTLQRVKNYQRRGERLVSTQDLEEAILEEALNGNGIVRAFPFTVNGNFDETRLGYTTVVAMTKNGGNLDALALQAIAEVLNQAVGNQFISVVNPFYVEFDITVNVRLKNNLPAGAVFAAIEKNLRDFYAPSREQFGRAIYRSEIIAVIEGTAGVERIVVANPDQILIQPTADRPVQNYELPSLVNVTINAV